MNFILTYSVYSKNWTKTLKSVIMNDTGPHLGKSKQNQEISEFKILVGTNVSHVQIMMTLLSPVPFRTCLAGGPFVLYPAPSRACLAGGRHVLFFCRHWLYWFSFCLGGSRRQLTATANRCPFILVISSYGCSITYPLWFVWAGWPLVSYVSTP